MANRYYTPSRRARRHQPIPSYVYDDECDDRPPPRPRLDIPALLVLLVVAALCGLVLYRTYGLPTGIMTRLAVPTVAPTSRAVPPVSPAQTPAAQPAAPIVVVAPVPTAAPAVAPTICAPPLCRAGGGGAGQGWADEAAPDAAPADVAPVEVAVPVPTTSAEQQANLAVRTSNGCKPGEVFYPRSGCHTPGSGGALPGAVGAQP